MVLFGVRLKSSVLVLCFHIFVLAGLPLVILSILRSLYFLKLGWITEMGPVFLDLHTFSRVEGSLKTIVY